ncbi:MAG: hypothetical protein K8F30_07895, partial [Taibaiella sp.]|nr:hypothetical protein [Taibaiella sp.]
MREIIRRKRIFHLIIDELHLYRGTAGTEVAYLLRLLLLRLGLYPGHPQLRILASSASLEPGNIDSKVFLKDFFGNSQFEIIEGKQQPLPAEAVTDYLPAEPFEYLSDNIVIGEEFSIVNEPVYKEVVRQLNIPSLGGTDFERLAWIVENKLSATTRLIRACEVAGRVRAVSIYDFASKLFGPGLDSTRLKKAARGLLISRGLLDEAGFKTHLPSFRIHYFFKNIEGLWASTKPLAGAPDQRPVGKIYHSTKIVDDTPEARRVLELLYCENCGTIFFGGSRLSLENGVLELLATTADIEGIPERQAARFVERRNYGDFAVFWPLGTQTFADPDRWRQRSLVSENNP